MPGPMNHITFECCYTFICIRNDLLTTKIILKKKRLIGLTATTAAVAHYTFSLCLIGKVFDAEINIFFFVHAEAMYLPNYL